MLPTLRKILWACCWRNSSHDVLLECTAEHKEKACPYHVALIKSLKPEAILSFNYDLICDKVLSSLWPAGNTGGGWRFDFQFDGKEFVKTENES